MRSERMRGIEPPSQAWEACVLPLNYIRDRGLKAARISDYWSEALSSRTIEVPD